MTAELDTETRIVTAMAGHDDREVAAILAIERAFAAHLAAGGEDTEEARARVTGSDREPHWRQGWEYARGDQARAA